MDPALLRLLEVYSSAQAIAQAAPDDLAALLGQVSAGAWTREHADALQRVARQSAASSRAVAARGVVVRTMLRHLLDLYARLAELEAAIAEVLAQDEDGQRLQTLPGVGPVIAAAVRAELGDVTRFQGVDQVIAYVGLDPRTHQSGALVGQKHLSKRGPGALRHALYLATLNAVRNRAEWRDRYRRLLDRGRPKKEALTILARAFLKVVYHLLCTGTPYDPLALIAPQPCPARGRA
jgi:transposase